MEPAKIIVAAEKYTAKLRSKGFEPARFSTAAVLPSDTEALKHALWMCEEIPKIVAEGKSAKAERWLCFAQCALWMTGLGSIDEFREDNAGS